MRGPQPGDEGSRCHHLGKITSDGESETEIQRQHQPPHCVLASTPRHRSPDGTEQRHSDEVHDDERPVRRKSGDHEQPRHQRVADPVVADRGIEQRSRYPIGERKRVNRQSMKELSVVARTIHEWQP